MGASRYAQETPFWPPDDRFFGRVRRRIVASIAGATAWISFTLIYVAFWASHFSIFQGIVVVVVSLLVLTACLLGAWVSMGIGFVLEWFD